MTFVCSCSKDDDNNDHVDENIRTVLLYACAENNLSGDFYNDMAEMLDGAKSIGKNNFIVFVDDAKSSNKPYIMKIDEKGSKKVYTFEQDGYCTSPEQMKKVMQWVVAHYPAGSYGLCFWGHGEGPIMPKDSIPYSAKKRAFGYDNGMNDVNITNGKWINIPTLAKVIRLSMPHLDFIFFDCCCMQSIEVDYELRNLCDYIISSPAEIPDKGAPYDYILADLFLPKEQIGKALVDDYIEYGIDERKQNVTGVGGLNDYIGCPLSVVKTEGLNNLAQATMEALRSFNPTYPNVVATSSSIYYYRISHQPILYDVKNVMKKNLSEDAYHNWLSALNQTVVYSRHPLDYKKTYTDNWDTMKNINFNGFDMNDDNYSGLSMFFPHDAYNNANINYVNCNEAIFKYEISNVIDWHEFGW